MEDLSVRLEKEGEAKALSKGIRLKSSQADKAEARLSINPDLKDLRFQLAAYYFDKGKEFAERRVEHQR